MKTLSERIRQHWPKAIGLLSVLASVLSIAALFVLDLNLVYEPHYLLGVTNTLFTAIIPVLVAFAAARTYLRTGSVSILLMGCGMLGFGLCAASAGWLRVLQDGANINVTIYNTGALLGSLCHITGALISSSPKWSHRESAKRTYALAPAYSAVILFSLLFSFAAVQQLVPPFFIQGAGPTAIRQLVLGLGIFLYAISSLFFMITYFRTRSDFIYWYSICLAMLALGLFAFYIQKVVGSPIGWVGRSSNYAGMVFSLVAILAAARSGRSRGLPLENVLASFFMDAEANYKSLVETASDAIISFDEENRIILWNSGAEKTFGYAKGEVLGTSFYGTLISEEQAKTLTEVIETSIEMGSQNTVDMEVARKNGAAFPVEISAFGRRLPSGRVTTCIVRDITERKRAEKELQESESRYRTLSENILEGVALHEMVYDANGAAVDYRIISANPAFERHTGLKPEQVAGRLASGLYGTGLPPYLEEYAKVARSGGTHAFEAFFPPMGRHFSISVTSPARNRFTTVFEDITDRKRMAEELRRSRDDLEVRVQARTAELQVSNRALMEYAAKLESLNEELRDFAFVAAHDLQEPLRKIQTFCDLAQKRCASALDGVGQEYLDRIVKSAGRMREFLRGLLQFSKVAAKPEPFKEIDLGGIAREAAALFEAELNEFEGAVEIEDMPPIEADEIQMLSLFQNLIGNGLRYRSDRKPRIRIYARPAGEDCEIFVEDNGIGFDQKYAERIFKPFQRLHGRKQYEGAGIGLAICRKIIDRHGGGIRAESELGNGSTFIIRLPFKQGQRNDIWRQTRIDGQF